MDVTLPLATAHLLVLGLPVLLLTVRRTVRRVPATVINRILLTVVTLKQYLDETLYLFAASDYYPLLFLSLRNLRIVRLKHPLQIFFVLRVYLVDFRLH